MMENKLQSMLTQRARSIGTAIQHIQDTGNMLDDYVVGLPKLRFGNGTSREIDGVYAQFPDHRGKHITTTMHDNAIAQLGARFGVPTGYLKNLSRGEQWQRELAAKTLNEFAGNIERERLLLRTVDGQMRAALSDRYRRINSMKVFLTFLLAAQEANSVLVDAHAGEVKNFMEVVHPEVVEFDTPNNGVEYVVFGARYRDSDFGAGASELRAFMLKVVCLNGMTGQQILKEVHLGGTIPENIEISQDTIVKDTEARAGFVRDAMNSVWKPQYKEMMVEKIKGASMKEVDVEKEVEKLPKLGLSKEEANSLRTILINNDPENGLQGAPTLWKLTNGLTAMARDAGPERGRELERIAGQMIGV